MISIRSAVAALAVLCSASPALAADAPASGPAHDLAQLLVPKELWNQGIEQLAGMVRMRLEGHPGSTKLQYPADMQKKIRSEVEAILPYNELVGMHAKELASTYSAAELNELLAFHKTATGKKWLQQQPKSFATVAAQTQQRVEQKMPEVMQRLGKNAKPPPGAKAPADAPKPAKKEPKKDAAAPAK